MQAAIKQFEVPNKMLWLIGGLLAITGSVALAGTTGPEFQILYTLVTDWMGGWLGRSVALAAVLIGVFQGFMRGTMMPALLGIGIAVLLFVAPNVVNGILAAPI